MSSPRIELDHQRCARHGLCTSVAPETFTLAGDGRVRIDARRADLDALARAERLCPEQAIRLHAQESR